MNWPMDTIDGEWVKKRLTGKRGEKAALARALGIGPDMVTKILNGDRNVQPAEFGPLLSFFGERIVPGPDERAEAIGLIMAIYHGLPPDLQAQLLREAETLALAAEALERRRADNPDDKGQEQ